MDDVFKRNLLDLRRPAPPKTFSEALLGPVTWGSTPRPRAPLAVPEVEKGAFTEKTQVLESLERFAAEKVKETQAPIIKIEGGELHVLPGPKWEGVWVAEDLPELLAALSVSAEEARILLSNKRPGMVKVLFIVESMRVWQASELTGGPLDEYVLGFPPKTAEYFSKMVQAMKLTSDEVALYPVEANGNDLTKEAVTVAAYLRPSVVITLGARASHAILKSSDRLTVIHGQFFQRPVEGAETLTVVPLFHPSIIETNLNMKKTAWADMQKIMRHLKKLP